MQESLFSIKFREPKYNLFILISRSNMMLVSRWPKNEQNPTSWFNDEEPGAGFSFSCALDFSLFLVWD